jgi:hypothetical protein
MAHLRRWHFGVPRWVGDQYQNQRQYGARDTSGGHSRMGQQRDLWISDFDGNCWKLHTSDSSGRYHANLAGLRLSRYKYQQFFSGCKDHEFGQRHPEH